MGLYLPCFRSTLIRVEVFIKNAYLIVVNLLTYSDCMRCIKYMLSWKWRFESVCACVCVLTGSFGDSFWILFWMYFEKPKIHCNNFHPQIYENRLGRIENFSFKLTAMHFCSKLFQFYKNVHNYKISIWFKKSHFFLNILFLLIQIHASKNPTYFIYSYCEYSFPSNRNEISFSTDEFPLLLIMQLFS